MSISVYKVETENVHQFLPILDGILLVQDSRDLAALGYRIKLEIGQVSLVMREAKERAPPLPEVGV
jgi:hypothetical protein